MLSAYKKQHNNHRVIPCVYQPDRTPKRSGSSSSSLARQPMVGPGVLKKLCPFVSVEGDPIPILDF